jgi:acyl transferase domain-containing protein
MDTANELRQIPLAIIGMACRLPGANGLEPFWKMLIEGQSAVADLPPERFDRALYYDPKQGVRNKSYTYRGAIVPHEEAESEDVPLPPDLARKSDVTHRMMCRVAADAFRHAGLDPYNLPKRNAGVYVGHTIGSDLSGDRNARLGMDEFVECLSRLEATTELGPTVKESVLQNFRRAAVSASAFAERARSRSSPEECSHSELASHMAAGLISKAFGLNGPFMSVNAACASSLQALVLAGRALQRGKIEMAVVGGASTCGRDWLVLFSQARSLTAGDSRPFDNRADGLIVAEAYVALIVKTLDRALADGDPIQAVIRGMGVSSDGRGRSLWAPRSEGQLEAIRRAYGPGVDIADVQYIEAHATATQLGDATEIASLRKAFNGAFPPGKQIPIASVKANIGHALEAAGLVGIVKTTLCMQKGIIPRAIRLEKLNTKVDWAAAPVYVPLETIPWPEPPAGKPRRAGVNAFGIGGLNVHVVLDAACDKHASSLAPRVKSSDRDDEAVAIIGLGGVFPGAHDLAAYWELLRSGGDARRTQSRKSAQPRNGFGTNGLPDSMPPKQRGGYVDGFRYDWRRHKIAPKEIDLADPLQFMALEAADQAIRDAGYDQKPFDRRRTGVIVGTEFFGDFTFRLQLALRLPEAQEILRESLGAEGVFPAVAAEIVDAFADSWHTAWPVLSDNTGSFSASSLAVRIAKSWDLMGCVAALDSGATSGMSALSAAVDLLLARDCDLMICGAAQRSMNAAVYAALERNQPLNGTGPGSPFDRGGTGFVPGEGAGMLLLKRLGDARRDGDRIQAVVRGIAAVHDVSSRSMTQSLVAACDEAGIPPSTLSLVMSDACGLSDVDDQVARAVLAAHSANGRPSPIHLGSVVGHIGHTGGASSIASLLAAVIALREGLLPGVQGFQQPILTLLRNGSVLQCSGDASPIRNGHAVQPHEDPLASAVLSQGKGLAYCAVIGHPVATEDIAVQPPHSAEMSATQTQPSKLPKTL